MIIMRSIIIITCPSEVLPKATCLIGESVLCMLKRPMIFDESACKTHGRLQGFLLVSEPILAVLRGGIPPPIVAVVEIPKIITARMLAAKRP